MPGVSGPQDCGLVYLVMSDPELRELLHRTRLTSLGERGIRPEPSEQRGTADRQL
jgi:hypothetical protein